MTVRPVLTAEHYTVLAAGYLLMVVYGSLVPFAYRAVPLQEAMEQFSRLPYLRLGIEYRADWVANILLFIPLSYLAMAALSVDRSRGAGARAAILVVPCCLLLSAAIEFMQIFFWPRTVSLNDMVAEGLGAVGGAGLWLGFGQRATRWGRRVWRSDLSGELVGLLLPGYVAFLILIHVVPLDLTLSPAELYDKYREGRIRLLPLALPEGGVSGGIEDRMGNLVYFFPVGLSLAMSAGWRRERREGLLPVAFALGLPALVELLQLFVYSRVFDSTDILTGTAAVLAGCFIGRLAARYAIGGGGERPETPAESSSPLGWATGVLVLLGWLGVLAIVSWQPFDFKADPALAARRFRRMYHIPFADYYQQSEYQSIDHLTTTTLLYSPLGVLGALCLPRMGGRMAGAIVAVGAASVAAGYEAGQFLLPSRYPSVSDVLVGGLSGWLGFVLTSHLRAAANHSLICGMEKA
ncbi:MAG: VanZ family protein [Planctomycetes bacterium]|nr:VanZ family protein [Planctomycetota bacterium]